MKFTSSTRLTRLPAVLVLLVFFSLPAQASLYCGSALVKVGDPQHRVARACPPPFYQEPLNFHNAGHPAGHHAYGHAYGHTVVMPAAEVWYLNFGSGKLMRRLVFSNGYLQRIDELGYGVSYPPGSRRCAVRDLVNAGSMTAEIYARCGAPDYVYSGLSNHHQANHYGVIQSAAYTRWIYAGAGDALDRELLFQQGRLLEIRAIPR